MGFKPQLLAAVIVAISVAASFAQQTWQPQAFPQSPQAEQNLAPATQLASQQRSADEVDRLAWWRSESPSVASGVEPNFPAQNGAVQSPPAPNYPLANASPPMVEYAVGGDGNAGALLPTAYQEGQPAYWPAGAPAGSYPAGPVAGEQANTPPLVPPMPSMASGPIAFDARALAPPGDGSAASQQFAPPMQGEPGMSGPAAGFPPGGPMGNSADPAWSGGQPGFAWPGNQLGAAWPGNENACCEGKTPGPPCGCGAPFCDPAPPRWYFRGEALWLTRDNPNNRDLTFFFNPFSASSKLNQRLILETDDFSLGFVSGLRLTLGHYVTRTTSIEAGYFGVGDWDKRQSTPVFPSTNGLGPLFPYWTESFGPFDTSAFSGSNQQIAAYSSGFQSAEVGVRHWFTPNTSMLFGFRYVGITDVFQLTALNDPQNSNAGDIGIYRTWTTNNLFGGQIGTEYSHELWFRWLYFSLEGKAGAFANAAKQSSLLFSTPTTDHEHSERGAQFAGLTELSLTLTALLGNHISLRGGYTFLFVDGISLATDQLDTNPTMTNSQNFIAEKGSMRLHGPFAGGEITW